MPSSSALTQLGLAKAADDLGLQRKREALQAILATGMAGLGIGAGARGLLGLRNMFTQKPPEVAITSSVPAEIPIGVPMRPEEEEKPKQQFKLASLAAALAKQAEHWSDPITSQMPDISTTNPKATAWGIPAIAAAGAGGTIGGWHLMNWLLDHQRHNSLDRQLDKAKEEYHGTIADQYRGALQKNGSASPFPRLDELFDALQLEKQAGLPTMQDATDYGNVGAGVALTALGALGLGSAYTTYNWAKNRGRDKLIAQAIRLRGRQRQAPQPMYAVPEEFETSHSPA